MPLGRAYCKTEERKRECYRAPVAKVVTMSTATLTTSAPQTATRWTLDAAQAVYDLPLNDLLFQAQAVHRQHHVANTVQISTLLSIKTGKCPENCSYCPQSAHFDTGLKTEPLMAVDEVLKAAQQAKAAGASRFCMGAAWRGPNATDLESVCEMVKGVKAMGLEACVTLGLLEAPQAEQLKEAGLDFYNHNLDTSEAHYSKIISTRTFDDRLKTLDHVQAAGLKTCCGGIVGMGETVADRLHMLVTLANMAQPPESVPINQLIPIPGTPLEGVEPVDPIAFVKTIAMARILMPDSVVRLSAGRETMSDELQALCFMAGANSIFYGETLLTAANPVPEKDLALFQRLGLRSTTSMEAY